MLSCGGGLGATEIKQISLAYAMELFHTSNDRGLARFVSWRYKVGANEPQRGIRQCCADNPRQA